MNKISLIAALSENNIIGKDNQLPWNIPEDLKRFKRLTSGHSIIMGRKTFESIGRSLPNRTNIVITRDPEKMNNIHGIEVVSSLEESLQLAQEKPGSEEIFIIGGGQIFQQAIGIANKLYITVVHTTLEGDALFPDYSMFTKKLFEEKGESNGYRYMFMDLEK